MAETVWYYDYTCPGCGLAGHIDQRQQAGDWPIWCPNCGHYHQATALEIKCDNCIHEAWQRNDERGKYGHYCQATGRSLLEGMDYADCKYVAEKKRPWKDQAPRTKELPWKA